MSHDPRAWFDATAERMQAGRLAASQLEVVGDLDRFQRDKRARMLRWLERQPVAQRRILEVGCGAGGNLRFLQARGARVEGADISPKMVQLATSLNAAARVDFPLHVIDGATLPQPPHSFDVVLTVTALQHNHDGPRLESLIRDMVRVLRPGGEAWIIEGVHRQRSVHRSSVHRTRSEYEAMFAAHGCEEIEYAALESHYPKWMARYQHVSTVAQRSFSRLGGRRLDAEADFERRYGDGAVLDGVASRALFAVCQVADRLRSGPDALGFFVFRKTR